MAVHAWSHTLSPSTETFNLSSLTTNATETYGDCIVVSQETVHVPCDNADNLISLPSRQLAEDVLYVGVLPLLTIIGIVTNVVNCIVFFQQGLRDRVSLCLFSLSLTDILYPMLLYPRFLNRTLSYFSGAAWISDVWDFFLVRYHLVALPAGLALMSNFISTIIAVDRCMCVTWPLRAARAVSTKVMATVIIVGGALAFSGMQVVAFKYDVTCAVLVGSNVSHVRLITTPSRLYKQHPDVLDVLDTFVFSALIPTLSLVTISVATTITTIMLSKATAWRQGKTLASASQGRATTGSKTSSCSGWTAADGKISVTERTEKILRVEGQSAREGTTSRARHEDKTPNTQGKVSQELPSATDSRSTMTQKEVGLTRMLVAISVAYIVCVNPRVLRSLCRFLVPGFRAWGSLCNLVLVTEAVMNVLLALNSALNFFVFYWLGSRYRATLHRLCARKRGRLSHKATEKIADSESMSRSCY